MSLIYESLAEVSGTTSGILYITTYKTTTWHTKPILLTGALSDASEGADPVYVTQVYGQLGSDGSPELLSYEGFVFLQAHSGGSTPKARYDLFIYDESSGNSVQLDVVPFPQEPSNYIGLTPVGFAVHDGNVYFNGTDGSGTKYLYEITTKSGQIKGANLGELILEVFDDAGVPTDPTSMVQYSDSGDSLFMNAVGAGQQPGLFALKSGSFQPFEGVNQNQSNSGPGMVGGFNPKGMAVGGSYLFMNGVNANKENALYVFKHSFGKANEAFVKNHGSAKPIDPIDIKGLPNPNANGDSVAYYSGVKDSVGNRTIFRTLVKPNGTFDSHAVEHDKRVPAHTVSNLDPYDLTLVSTDLFFTGNRNDTGNDRGLFILDTIANSYKEVESTSAYNFLFDINVYELTAGDQNPITLTAKGGVLYFGALKTGSALPQIYELTVSGSGGHQVKPVTSNNLNTVGIGPVSLTHS